MPTDANEFSHITNNLFNWQQNQFTNDANPLFAPFVPLMQTPPVFAPQPWLYNDPMSIIPQLQSQIIEFGIFETVTIIGNNFSYHEIRHNDDVVDWLTEGF